jgi:hypothetical protein
MKEEITVAEKRELRQAYRQLRKGTITYNEWCKYLDIIRKDCSGVNPTLSKILLEEDEAKKRLESYIGSPMFRFRIRKYCNYHSFSDIDPCEVVRVISPRMVEIRHMDAAIKKAPEHHLGGFLAHTENDTQRWVCISNQENPTEIITLTKKGWKGGQCKMSDKPIKFYDYNF